MCIWDGEQRELERRRHHASDNRKTNKATTCCAQGLLSSRRPGLAHPQRTTKPISAQLRPSALHVRERERIPFYQEGVPPRTAVIVEAPLSSDFQFSVSTSIRDLAFSWKFVVLNLKEAVDWTRTVIFNIYHV
jgi:hypothetical protein